MVGGGAPLGIRLDSPGYPRICLHCHASVSTEVPQRVGGGGADGTFVLLRHFYGFHHSIFYKCELIVRCPWVEGLFVSLLTPMSFMSTCFFLSIFYPFLSPPSSPLTLSSIFSPSLFSIFSLPFFFFVFSPSLPSSCLTFSSPSLSSSYPLPPSPLPPSS